MDDLFQLQKVSMLGRVQRISLEERITVSFSSRRRGTAYVMTALLGPFDVIDPHPKKSLIFDLLQQLEVVAMLIDLKYRPMTHRLP